MKSARNSQFAIWKERLFCVSVSTHKTSMPRCKRCSPRVDSPTHAQPGLIPSCLDFSGPALPCTLGVVRNCLTVDRRDGYYWNRKNGANRARTSASSLELLKRDWEQF